MVNMEPVNNPNIHSMTPSYEVTIECKKEIIPQIEQMLREHNIHYQVIDENYIFTGKLSSEARCSLSNLEGISIY